MTIERKPLTPRQRAILQFVGQQVSSKGYPPSVREIGEAVGLSSSSTVHSHLRSLEKKGYLRRDPSKPRALVILGTPEQDPQQSLLQEIHSEGQEVRMVPLLGRVAAGIPITATENVEEVLPLPASYIGSGNVFMLEVQGDSMIDAGIFNKDFVIVREQKTASNGEIVVAMIEDEATVKRFYKRSDHIELVAENPAYEPIRAVDVSVVGKVVAVFRSLR